MKANMGTIDRVVRIIIAIVVGVLYYQGIITGAIGLVLLVLAAVFLFTSFFSICPLYLPFGLSTKKKSN